MKLLVKGPVKLKGKVQISGDKNTALKIIPATLLTNKKVILHNVPDIEDVRKTIEIAKHIGSEVEFKNNTLTIQTKTIKNTQLPDELSRKIRTSIMFIPPLISRAGKAKVSFPGGCAIGKRPIDAHVNGLKTLGIDIKYDGDYIVAKSKKIKSNTYTMEEFSVTGTEIVLMTASVSNGLSRIKLCALEPSVTDLAIFLEKLGVKISGKDTHTLSIIGTDKFLTNNGKPIEHTIIPDRIEAATFIIGAIATNGDVIIEKCNISHLNAFLSYLDKMNVKYKIINDKTIHIQGIQKLKNIKLQTRIYPGFPTDMLSPMTILMLKANGKSQIFETIYENRLSFLNEIELMGAELQILNPHQAMIFGPIRKFKGTQVTSYDLRAGATMILAGLIADGTTEISNITYIDRGYEKFDEKLQKLGVDIKRIE